MCEFSLAWNVGNDQMRSAAVYRAGFVSSISLFYTLLCYIDSIIYNLIWIVSRIPVGAKMNRKFNFRAVYYSIVVSFMLLTSKNLEVGKVLWPIIVGKTSSAKNSQNTGLHPAMLPIAVSVRRGNLFCLDFTDSSLYSWH